LQQKVDGLRWTSPQFYDRGNLSHAVEFETTRQFESFAAMQAFMFGLSEAHAWEGTVTFRQDGESPGTYTEFDLLNCIITPPTLYPTGVSLRLYYRLEGGAKVGPRIGAEGAMVTEDDDTRLTEDGEIRVTEEEPEI
jgi:hypothetical protein